MTQTSLEEKLAILADAAKYDASCASSGSRRANREGMLGDTDGIGICHSYTPDGRCVSLLKILLTNYCIYDCRFCVNRVSSDRPRARFSVDEVVWLTVEFYKRNYIEGLFLSSGIIQSPDYTMERLVEVARRLRLTEKFNGYIHLKAIPGADATLLERAGLYADRLSANIELPNDDDLKRFAPEKSIQTVDLTMSCIRERRDEAVEERKKSTAAPEFAPAGQSTQMIVGATETSDAEILQQSTRLYSEHRLKRVYYTAFSPIPSADPQLPAMTPPLIREHRLYQSDWLIRFYGFKAEELTAGGDANLSLDVDPKYAWALRNLHFFPIDINVAPRETLLRVPGLGVRNVNRIVGARRVRKLRLADLMRLRVPLRRTKPFIIAQDWSPAERDATDLISLRSRRQENGFPAMLASRSRPLLMPLASSAQADVGLENAVQATLFATAVSARTGEV
jgi:putative DNA modification/repair radical SAM protein